MSLNNISDEELNLLLEKTYEQLDINFKKYNSDKKYLNEIKLEIQKRCIHKWIRDDGGCVYGSKTIQCCYCGKIKS